MSENKDCTMSTHMKMSLMVSIVCCAILFLFVVGYVGRIQSAGSDSAARLDVLQQRVDQLDSQMAEVQKAITGILPPQAGQVTPDAAVPPTAMPPVEGGEPIPAEPTPAPAPATTTP